MSSRRVAIVFVVVFLAVQVFLPIRGFGDGVQSRFAWEMYSREWQRPLYHFVMSDGTRQRVKLDRYVWARKGLKESWSEFVRVMPGHLCDSEPDARAVIGLLGEVHPCG